MLFNSAVFLGVFLPLVLLAFYSAGRWLGVATAMCVLSLASVLFYAYWNPIYILLILAEVGFSFLMGRYLASPHISEQRRKIALVASLGLLLVVLGYFKYTNLLLDAVDMMAGTNLPYLSIILPLGISFHTFQQIAYLVDAYANRTQKYRLEEFFLFVVFFPQLIAGPIVHHHELIPQLRRPQWNRLIPHNLLVGFGYFSLGLFKKTVIADSLSQIANPIFDSASTGVSPIMLQAWLATLAYTLQIYFDFSAYSDMAVGLARMFNLRLPLNFFSPYKAANISQFWRRWHISLSRFLRDYLYIPLGGSRRGNGMAVANLMITMLLGGLWHGAGLQFIIWGGLHGLFLGVHRTLSPLIPDTIRGTHGYRIAATAFTFLCVMLAWVFFRSADLGTAILILKSMVSFDFSAPTGSLKFLTRAPFDGWPVLVGALLLAFFAPNLPQIFRRFQPALLKGVLDRNMLLEIRSVPSRYLLWRPGIAGGIVIGTAFALGFLAIFAWQSDFLYFQF